MKRKQAGISVLLLILAGIFIVAGYRWMEKQDRSDTAAWQQETVNKSESQEKAKKEQKEDRENKAADEEEQKTAGGNKTAGTQDSDETADAIRQDTEKEEQEEISNDTQKDAQENISDSIVFAGDVYISRHVETLYDTGGIHAVLDDSLSEQMQDADLTVVNEEFPFGSGGTAAEDKQYTFRVDPHYSTLLTDLGIDLVSLANNHVLDYGTDVLNETFDVLTQKGIVYAGAGKSPEEASALRTFTVGDSRYGFLAASRVIPESSWNVTERQPGVFTAYDDTALLQAIRQAQGSCDFLTVYLHWGIERNNEPEEYQKELAHACIDAGADLVIGAHPHVLQGIESYQGKMIFYSLGNFIFNQSIEKTMLIRMERAEDLCRYQIIPAKAVAAKTIPYDDIEEFYCYIEQLSGEKIRIEDGWIEVVESEGS